MRLLPIFAVLIACSGDDLAHLDPDVPLVTEGDWARPTAAATWQWQLTGTINTSYDVDIYDVDLFDVRDATFQTLHADDRLIACYFSAGSVEDWRDDASAFPEEAIGRRLGGWAGERWLDIRHPAVTAALVARLDLSAERGCDLVELDNVDGWDNNTGFDLNRDDTLGFLRNLANEAHERGLGIAKKNGAGTVDDLEPWFDLAVVEECAAYDECDAWDAFIDADKPVLQAEYPKPDTAAAAAELADEICPDSLAGNRRVLVLPLELDDSFRESCDDR
jgi:hypothetical protein